ncbi:PorH family porin [Corynebacterium sp.]|uniref:PorH family porin n=1 Tax=Corynebacterium sp. TaxID=1720 RepID=UPI0037367177
MDLSVVQDILNNVATFGKNIGQFLEGPVEIIKTLGGFFSQDVAEKTEGTTLSSAWDTTAGILSSSK